jgi:TonB family protein
MFELLLFMVANRSSHARRSSDTPGVAPARNPLFAILGFSLIVCFITQGTFGAIQEKPGPAPVRLLADLRSKDKGDRRDAANQLGVLRARGALRALVEALSDKDAPVREAAAFALGQISDPAATGLLVPLLADPEPSVRASTAFAIGMIADRKGAEALSYATGDADPEVRASAIFALGLMKDEAAVDELIEALDDPSFDVRYDAVWALGQIGEPDAEEPLRGALVTVDLARIDDSQRLAFRQAVQFSLESLRTEAHARATESGTNRPRRATGVVKDNRYTPPPSRPVGIHKSVKPAITDVALKARAGGSVKLRVLVGADGKAVRVYVTRRLGYGLDRRAVEAALQYRFDPELEGGLPQTTWTDMEVKF